MRHYLHLIECDFNVAKYEQDKTSRTASRGSEYDENFTRTGNQAAWYTKVICYVFGNLLKQTSQDRYICCWVFYAVRRSLIVFSRSQKVKYYYTLSVNNVIWNRISFNNRASFSHPDMCSNRLAFVTEKPVSIDS